MTVALRTFLHQKNTSEHCIRRTSEQVMSDANGIRSRRAAPQPADGPDTRGRQNQGIAKPRAFAAKAWHYFAGLQNGEAERGIAACRLRRNCFGVDRRAEARVVSWLRPHAAWPSERKRVAHE